MNYQYKISVIIPIYNSGDYLAKTIKSVINQTLEFKKNIQLILINDGSTDNSEKICLKYKSKYPANIEYFYKKNEGVSAARNFGMQYIKGKYVNFLDSDDIIDKDAYQKAYNMLETEHTIDLVAFRLKYFEASDQYHWLDYKFDSDKIIDINAEPQNIVLHINSTVIREEALKNFQFDVHLQISEDTKALYELILKKEKYGVISSSNYNYRKRKNHTSAIQSSQANRSWYVDSFQYCYDYLIKLSIEKYGKVIQFVQHFIMYDIQWRIQKEISTVITREEKEEYIQKIRHYLKQIDDEVILFQAHMNFYYKLLALKVKYEDKLENYLSYKEDGIYLNDKRFVLYEDLINYIEISNIEQGSLNIIGHTFIYNQLNLYYKLNGRDRIKIETYKRKALKQHMFGEQYEIFCDGYCINIKLEDVRQLEFELEINGKFYELKNDFIHFSQINNFLKGYLYENKYLITKAEDKRKIIIKYKPFKLKVFYREIYYLAYLIIKGKNKIAFMRMIYWLTKPFMPKNIWLFADREFMARDSAEELFKYTNQQPNPNNRKTYFAIEKKSTDYKRMQQYGKVVSYHSLKYKLLFLNAKYLISSHADGYVNNEFGNSRKFYVDLYRFKYIYLTHGVLLHDSSSWLNRVNKNFELNVVTSPMEHQSILDGYYYFKPEQLIKTGLPRHDKLINHDVKEENKILIMASWRSTLVGPELPGTQRREYNPKFKESEYFQFYNKLLNDKNLQNVLKEYHYKMKFCIHPSFRGQFKDFKGNDFVEIAIDVDSQYETLSSKVLITDYSSAACDFAYLKKPVIYANFDLDHIYEVHYYNKGYFDYDKDGFGPNCKNYDSTIEAIINTIKNNCKMEEVYKKRCEKFFYYHDNQNTKRVYEAIIQNELDNAKK